MVSPPPPSTLSTACSRPASDRSTPSTAKAVVAAAALSPRMRSMALPPRRPSLATCLLGRRFLTCMPSAGTFWTPAGCLMKCRRGMLSPGPRSSVGTPHADAGMHPAVLGIFRFALEDALQVNDFTISCIVRVCAAATLFELGAQVHARSINTSLDASPFVGTLTCFSVLKVWPCGFAYQVFSAAPERNIGIWNAVLIASAQHGHTSTAFERFVEMQNAGFRSNSITFLCLLTVCSHAGLVDEGKRYFSLMKEYSIEPQAEHYAAMVDLLGCVGRISEALDLIESMPMEPPEPVWGALLMACRMFKDADTAAIAAKRLFETGSRSSGAHMLLSSTYVASGRHVDAALARKAMGDAGVRKETGLSWLEAAGGGAYLFVKLQ